MPRWFQIAALCSIVQVLAGCQEAGSSRIMALALQPSGTIAIDIDPSAWQVKVNGAKVQVQKVAPPSEVVSRPVKWVFVLLPVRDPMFRKLTLLSIGSFLKTLPPSDSVLMVVQGEKGLTCLTPGFTRRPSLWAAALERAIPEFQAGLHQNAATFLLPPAPLQEPQEDPAPLAAMMDRLEKATLSRQLADTRSSRSFKDDYVDVPNTMVRVVGSRYERLRGWTRTAVETLKSLEAMIQAVSRETGEKQVVLFSRNELDDLGSPLWARDQLELDVADMSSTVRLALVNAGKAFTRSGMTIHLVSGSGLGYPGALGEAALATGGFSAFFQQSLPARMASTLETWVNRYEITFQLPAGTVHPSKVKLELPGTTFKVFAPTEF